MKCLLAIPMIPLLVFLFVCALKVEAASDEAPLKVVENLLTVHEVVVVTNALSEIQTLWPDQAQAYEQCVKHILDVLAGAPSNEVTKQASRRLFANVAGSSIVTNREDRSSLLRLKCALIVQCLNVLRIKDDVSTWHDIASIVGEVRSQIIPQYVKQGRLNPLGMMGASQEEIQRIIAENRSKLVADEWQQELFAIDRKLTVLLMGNVKDAASKMKEPQRKQFVVQIRLLARLNDVEARKLMDE